MSETSFEKQVLQRLSEIKLNIDKLFQKIDEIKDDHNALSKRVDRIEFQCEECRKDREDDKQEKETSIEKFDRAVGLFLKLCATLGVVAGGFYIAYQLKELIR